MKSQRVRRALRGAVAAVAVFAVTVTTAGAAKPSGGADQPDKDQRTPLADVAKPSDPQVPDKTWKVDTHGTFSDKIPLQVPGFHQIAPDLSLTYQSAEENSWAGVGWSLTGVAEIERAGVNRGAPKYDATDIYLLDGQEFVPCATGSVSPSCTTSGTHSTKNESYSRIALSGTGSASRWTVTAKDGTRRIYAPVYTTGTDLVFRWGLSQVVDTVGNTVTYNWASNQFGCCWESLDSITYNGTTVKLYYETRPDTEQQAVGNGLSTVLGRIKTVDVTVGGNRVRAYKLTYTTSGATARSLLSSVQQFGKDAVVDATGTITGGTSLPATTNAYKNGTIAFDPGVTDTTMGGSTDARHLELDVNGDGRTDLLELYPNLTVFQRKTWISNGTGFTLASTANDLPLHVESRFLTGDVTGDGKADLIEIYPNGLGWGRRLWISNGTGFTKAAATGNWTGRYDENGRFLSMDVNGDGRTDVLELYSCGIFPVHYCRATWLSNGNGFTRASNDTGISYDDSKQFRAGDFNGDGRTDLLELSPGLLGVGGRHLWLSTGTGFVSGASDSGINWSPPGADGSGSRFLMMDLNGDEKTDMVELYPFLTSYTRRAWISTGYGFTLASTDTAMPNGNSSQQLAIDVNGDQRTDLVELAPGFLGLSTQRRIWLSTGTGFALGVSDPTMGTYNCDKKGVCTSEFLGMDVNGDGLAEMVELHAANFGLSKARNIWKIGGPAPDALASRTNEYGAKTSVSYKPSSEWSNTTNRQIVQTATAVTVDDGRGGTATTQYSYTGGAYDWSERQFLGFRQQRETAPCNVGEAACPYTETWFRQDLASVGLPERRERRTGDGKLLAATVQDYTTDNSALPRTSLLTGTWEYSYAGDGTACPGADCKRKYTSQEYNSYGEVTQLVEHGDNELAGDERTTATTFVPNTSAYVVNKPAVVTKYQGVGTAGAKLTETRSYYDSAPDWKQAPSKGLETRNSKWLSTTNSYADTRQEYDTFGNVTALIDQLGARTTLAWDSTYHQFQTSETNALSQQVTAAWDVTCAAPTLVRKPGNLDTTVSYDALCRRAEMTEPGGKFERYSWVNVGDAATQYVQTERPPADGTPQWNRRYIDGLQRTWRTATKGPDAATGDIYVDTTFNARGLVGAKTAEYYWVSGQPQPTTYPTVTAYDALDRITKVTAPGGAAQTKSYGLWSTTETDERGHAVTEKVNAFDKRVASTEQVNGIGRTAAYVFDGNDNLVQSTDPDGNVIAYTRDSNGNATKVVDPDSGVTTYEWDAAGRLTAQTDAKNQRTTFSYDALGRKTSQTSRAGTASSVTSTWTYDQARSGYYNVGQLTTLTDSAGTRTSDYDNAGRVAKSVRTIDGTAYTFEYGFDAGDRPLWTTYPDGYTVGTEAAPLRYDGAGRLVSIPGVVTAARYTAAGKLVGLDNANGTATTIAIDPERGWVTGITTMAGGTAVQDNNYTRDAKGNVTKVTSPFAGESWTYGYDEAEQLTASTGAAGQTTAYDGTGNITSNSRLGSYTYSASRPHAVATAGSNSYTYDAAGLMTAGGGRTLTWDGENRLASVTKSGSTTTFTYDGEGARIQSVEGGITRRYLGDDYEVEVASGTATKYISVAGQLVARVDGSTKYWVHTDQQGSVQAVTDASGNEVHRKKYAAFGKVLSVTGPLTREARGFTAQRQEDSTGLLYLHSRYYDPELGRFISPNPVIDGDDTIGLNRYTYAANNPVSNADRTGLDCSKGDAKCDRNNWHNYGQQKHLDYSCGPAAVRVALDAQGVVVDDESDLYGPLGTTTNGTDSIGGNIVPFLNARLNTTFYEAKDIPGSKADQEHIDRLKADIVTDINANRPIVANVTIGAAQDTDGDYHQYGGHYITIVGYDDYGNKAHIYDSADVNRVYQYWMTTDNLATWIAGKGYAG